MTLRTKLLLGLTGLVLSGLLAFVAYGLLTQSDSARSTVTATDLVALTVAGVPAEDTDWLTIGPGESTSGAAPLTMTTGDLPVVVETLLVNHSEVAFLGALTLRIDYPCGVPGYAYTLSADGQLIALANGAGIPIAANTSIEVCGELLYDQTVSTAVTDLIDFHFSTHN